MASASTRSSPPPRRVLAIKRADGEPLTRADLQYDFLNGVFGDKKAVFTDPYALAKEGEPATKVCFGELYIKTIMHSPKATKALKDKMGEPSTFAADFAMLSLLVNVGRVNTTMSFFPEMKTTIRTYHPVPSLQRTNGNMQDAPRLKQILKTCLLDEEIKNPPTTPGDILTRAKEGPAPSTSVTNLVSILAHHTGPVGQTHFHGQFDFLDFFLRTEVSSASRAQAFLWLCYNYLESPAPLEDEYDEEVPENPFADPVKKSSPPSFVFLTQEEISKENQESKEDIALADKMRNHRTRILQTHGAKEAMKEASKASAKGSTSGSTAGDDAAPDDDASIIAEEPRAKGKKAPASAPSTRARGKRAAAAKEKPKAVLTVDKPKETKAIPTVLDMDDDRMIDAFVKQRPLLDKNIGPEPFEHPAALFATLPSQRNGVGADHSAPSANRARYSPYAPPATSKRHTRPTHFKPRSMIQQAWHVVSSIDPLVDSDDESVGDEYTREDYLQRLEVIKRFSQPQFIQDQQSLDSPNSMDVDIL